MKISLYILWVITCSSLQSLGYWQNIPKIVERKMAGTALWWKKNLKSTRKYEFKPHLSSVSMNPAEVSFGKTLKPELSFYIGQYFKLHSP